MKHTEAFAVAALLAIAAYGPAQAQGTHRGTIIVAGPPDSAFSSFAAFLKKQSASVIRNEPAGGRIEAKIRGSDESIVFLFTADGDSTAINAAGSKGGMGAGLLGLAEVNDWRIHRPVNANSTTVGLNTNPLCLRLTYDSLASDVAAKDFPSRLELGPGSLYGNVRALDSDYANLRLDRGQEWRVSRKPDSSYEYSANLAGKEGTILAYWITLRGTSGTGEMIALYIDKVSRQSHERRARLSSHAERCPSD
jgi:hypothetical protein